jgi:hypothetical protein
MKALGLLVWQRRLVRAGWRVAQTSNAYLLTLAEAGTLPTCTGGHSGRQTKKIDFISVEEPDLCGRAGFDQARGIEGPGCDRGVPYAETGAGVREGEPRRGMVLSLKCPHLSRPLGRERVATAQSLDLAFHLQSRNSTNHVRSAIRI